MQVDKGKTKGNLIRTNLDSYVDRMIVTKHWAQLLTPGENVVLSVQEKIC